MPKRTNEQEFILHIDPESCPKCRGAGYRINLSSSTDEDPWCDCPKGKQQYRQDSTEEEVEEYVEDDE